MSLSRGLSLLRHARSSSNPSGIFTQQVRNSGGLYSYRCGAYPPNKLQKYGSEALAGFMWFWMLYHIVTEPEHITGEFPWPDPKKWTNEELGIPDDDLD
ncbi:hypothetical protein GE061_013448 [Apolygus lucorum]|uniref:Uncharacterized protein n=1 Tax=Apolygus lucorum TaxID=248454 RepID=A0A6A4KBV0_APOLU|nr:hypothetical protein GE061_013448 [Apolygus lucorum]